MFFEALTDTTLVILMICAVVSIIINMIFAHSDERAVGRYI